MALTAAGVLLACGCAVAYRLFVAQGFGETSGGTVGEVEHTAPNLVLRSSTVHNLEIGVPQAITGIEAFNGGTAEGRIARLEITVTDSNEQACKPEWFKVSGELTSGLGSPIGVPHTTGNWTMVGPNPQLELKTCPARTSPRVNGPN